MKEYIATLKVNDRICDMTTEQRQRLVNWLRNTALCILEDGQDYADTSFKLGRK